METHYVNLNRKLENLQMENNKHNIHQNCVMSGDFTFAKWPFILSYSLRCRVCTCVRGFCHSLQEAINTSATSILGRNSGLPFCLKNCFLRGAWLNVPFRQLQLCLYFLGLGSVSAMGDTLWRHLTPNSDAI